MLLEIAVFNLQSAILAANAGADRLELCENAAEGGATPSYGMLKIARQKINIPIFPMIRPRGGDFLYNDEEYNVMIEDIKVCKALGYEGVVFGMLTNDGKVDKLRCSKLVELSYPLEVTFHRAFDRTKDAMQSLEDIIEIGCQRILTSGQVPNALDGATLIKQLIDQAAERIIIMPGSGVRSNNIQVITAQTGAVEFHSSARITIKSAMQHVNETMHDDLQILSVDAGEIMAMKNAIK